MTNARRTFHDEPRTAIVKRRIVTVPRSFAIALVATLVLPALFIGALVVDLVRWFARRVPFVAVRLVTFGWVFSLVEVLGLVRMFGVWIGAGFGRSETRLMARTWPIQAWWAKTLLRFAQQIFDLELEITGLEHARPGPIVAMFRHASILDNLLPAVLLQARLGYELRWILKRELLAITPLDVAGTRLPNHFVDRSGMDPRRELRAIRRLSAGLSENEGVLIFPEGTRYTPDRQRRMLVHLAQRDPALAERAKRLRHSMPPRPGGVLTLLDNGYDVVVCAHEGLDGFAKISDLWGGGLVGRTITIELWRIPGDEIPPDRQGRLDWLYSTWQTVDDWIGATRKSAV